MYVVVEFAMARSMVSKSESSHLLVDDDAWDPRRRAAVVSWTFDLSKCLQNSQISPVMHLGSFVLLATERVTTEGPETQVS